MCGSWATGLLTRKKTMIPPMTMILMMIPMMIPMMMTATMTVMMLKRRMLALRSKKNYSLRNCSQKSLNTCLPSQTSRKSC